LATAWKKRTAAGIKICFEDCVGIEFYPTNQNDGECEKAIAKLKQPFNW